MVAMQKNHRTHTLMLSRASLSFTEGTAAFTKLRSDVRATGILNRAYRYYLVLSCFVIVGFLLSIYQIIVASSPWAVVIWSILLGFFTVQFGGLLHDAGHRAIFWSTKANDIVGYIYAAFANLSYAQWRETHNKHHARPNEHGEDPDVGIVFHAFTEEQLATSSPIVRALSKYQAYLFYPLRSLTFLTARYESFHYFRTHHSVQTIITFFFFLLGIFLWFVAPFLFFSLWKALLFFFVANFTIGIYASNIFAPNHKGMPQVKKGVKFSFLEQQIATARNITPGIFTDFFYIGLNYQIEHHLFPACPRNKLHLLSPFVQSVCKRYGLPYTSESVWETHRSILSQLRFIGNMAKE